MIYPFFCLLALSLVLTGCTQSAKRSSCQSDTTQQHIKMSTENNTKDPTSLVYAEAPLRLSFTDSSGYTIPYCLYLPSSIRDQKKDGSYPLVLFLHGAGERGSDNLAQTNDTGIIPSLIKEDFYSEHPCIILAPQCPEGEQWVDVPWTEGSYSIDTVPVSEELAAVTELLEDICTSYPVDTSRICAAGVSMGGYAAWDILLRNPDTFSRAVILCGAGDPSHAADIADIPLWVFHGAKDTEVPVSGSREMTEALKAAGASELHYTEYPDMGHWIWLAAYEEPGLLEWLLSCSQ